jgi:lipid-binding SYLF domain-containing protein
MNRSFLDKTVDRKGHYNGLSWLQKSSAREKRTTNGERFTDERIAYGLRKAEGTTPAAAIYRQPGCVAWGLQTAASAGGVFRPNPLAASAESFTLEMRTMNSRLLRSCIARGTITAVFTLVATAALALDTAAIDTQVSATLDKFFGLSGQNLTLANNAVAVLIFPDITKGGIGIGGEHGYGALQEHGKTVAYYSISGASIGLTLGLSHHSQVILFNTPEARDKFVNGGNWSVGADASVALMKTGASGSYDTQSFSKPVMVFVFGERGLMGDASLGGAKISKVQQ